MIELLKLNDIFVVFCQIYGSLTTAVIHFNGQTPSHSSLLKLSTLVKIFIGRIRGRTKLFQTISCVRPESFALCIDLSRAWRGTKGDDNKRRRKELYGWKDFWVVSGGSFLFACTIAARRGDVGAMGEGGLCQLFRSALWLLCNKTWFGVEGVGSPCVQERRDGDERS